MSESKYTKYIVLDCETDKDPNIVGWKNFKEQGIRFLGVYDINEKKYEIFDEHNKEDFIFRYLSNPDCIFVGFNLIVFDIPLIKHNWVSDREFKFRVLDIRYILQQITQNKYIKGSLGSLAELNIDKQKDSIDFVDVFAEKASFNAKLINYLLNDLRITFLLFRHLLLNDKIMTEKDTLLLPKDWKTKYLVETSGLENIT